MKIEDSCDRFRYVAHGKFIVDCIQNKAYFNFLIKEYLEVDMKQFIEDEKDRNLLAEQTNKINKPKPIKVNIG